MNMDGKIDSKKTVLSAWFAAAAAAAAAADADDDDDDGDDDDHRKRWPLKIIYHVTRLKELIDSTEL